MSSIAFQAGTVTVSTVYNAVPVVLADGALSQFQADVNGYLKVNISANSLKGQATMANSMPVVIASDQSDIPIRLKDGAGSAVNKGQAAMAASLPVVLASDQSAIPVSQSGAWNITNITGTITLPTGASTSALQSTGNTSIASIDTKTPTVGQKAMSASSPVVIASDQSAIPASQSGTWSVRLQDGAGSAVNKGQGAMAASLPVVLASDQSAIPVKLQDGAGSAVNKGQAAMAGSIPVVIASDQTGLSVTPGKLSVVAQMDTAVFDAAVTTINANSGAFVQVVASLAAAAKQIRVSATTGEYIGVYVGAAASEVLKFIIGPGMDDAVEHAIPINSRISLRSMTTSTVTVGNLALQFQA